jgi:hypothetical protein
MLLTINTPSTCCTYPIAVKHAIVQEAYITPCKIKAVARQYNVQPHQIHEWRNFFESNNIVIDNVADTATKTCTVTGVDCWPEGSIWCTLGWRLWVSLRIMVTKLQRLSPASVNGSLESSINSHVYHLLCKWDNTWRQGTHKAQNTRHSSEVIGDFFKHFRLKFRLIWVDCSWVYNVDEKNGFFSQEPVFTYAKQGSWTVSIKWADSSQRCTIVLYGNLAGGKLLPFRILKEQYSYGS